MLLHLRISALPCIRI